MCGEHTGVSSAEPAPAKGLKSLYPNFKINQLSVLHSCSTPRSRNCCMFLLGSRVCPTDHHTIVSRCGSLIFGTAEPEASHAVAGICPSFVCGAISEPVHPIAESRKVRDCSLKQVGLLSDYPIAGSSLYLLIYCGFCRGDMIDVPPHQGGYSPNGVLSTLEGKIESA